MKHIILIHALFMKSFTMYRLGRKIESTLNDSKIDYFDYPSTKFSSKIIDDLSEKIETIKLQDNDEIILIGHSMGGLVARLYLSKYKPNKKISLITLGTPHKGSDLGKFLYGTPFSYILGSSGKSGIAEKIEPWLNQYPLYCVAGSFHHKLFLDLFNLNENKLDNDGTVFVQEATLDNSTKNIIIPNTAHMQLLFSDNVFNEIKQIL